MVSIVLVALLSTHRTNGIASLGESNHLAARVVDLINQGDASSVVSMALPEVFEKIPAEVLPRLIQQVHSFGVLTPPTLILDLGEQRRYRISIKKDGKPDRQILMTLGAESDSKYFLLSMGPWREKDPNSKPLVSDNRNRLPVDMAVQAAVDNFLLTYHPTGISIGVLSQNRQSIYNYGEASQAKLPSSSTIYEIGSITKTMTGLLLAKATLDKKVSLDEDIRKYLPGTFPNLEFEGRAVTLRDLATHTSGLPANPPGIPDDAKAVAYAQYSHEKLLTDLASIRLTRRPGSQFAYSNMGGGLCGFIIGRLYGQSYETILKNGVFAPLKMRQSGVNLTHAMDLNYAKPFDALGKPTDRWTVNGIEGAGAVRSSMEDMMKFARFNLNERNPAVLLSHSTQSRGTYPRIGLFWLTESSRLGGKYIGHEGGTGGFTSHILVMPEKQIAVVVMMNKGEQNAGDLAYEIAFRILQSRQLH
jgi:CubicO group peptidase (beta-lactamase class C family)